MGNYNQGPFRFMNFREWVPDSLRFWIYIVFLTAFQFSNGMYFTAMSQMEGELSITMNDVKMMSHAVLIGLTIYFPLAFRLKFRFTNRTSLMVAAAGLALCNLIVPHVSHPWLLVLLGFAGGFLRLYGTFECFSNILPKIAPTYNYRVFLSFVFFVVLGAIHVFDGISINIVHFWGWQRLHTLAVGMLIMVFLMAMTLMRPFRPAPKMPLLGIDWGGMILWSIFILSAIFIVQYGHQLEWLASPYIRIAIGVVCISLAFNIGRMTYIRHPFLEAKAFRVHNLWNLMILFLCLGILLASKNSLQNIYAGGMLHYGQITLGKLKWIEFFGALLGAIFSWQALTRFNLGYKTVTFIGFTAVVAYVGMMYFIITPYTNLEKLFIPLVLCNFGHLAIFIALTSYIQATAPFPNYFQILCILGFIRTGIASPIGDTLYQTGISGLIGKHAVALGSYPNAFAATLQELYGYTFLFGIVVLTAIASSRFKQLAYKPLPALRTIYDTVKSKMGL